MIALTRRQVLSSALLGTAALWLPSVARAGQAVGAPALPIELPLLSGGTLKLADVRGRVVLLDFWASWCEPCQKELPELERLHKTLADTGPVVLGVNLDKDRKNALRYVQRLGLTFRMLHDPQGKTAEAYDPPKMPTSYVIDKTGIVRYINEGYHSPDDLRRVGQQIAELNR